MTLLCGVVVSLLAAATTPAQVHDVAREVLGRSEYQTRLPTGDQKPEPLITETKARDYGETLRVPWAFQQIARVVMWGLMGVGLLILGYFLVSELSSYAGDPWVEAPLEAAAAGGGLDLHRPLGDADALAEQGQFGEAIHVLLLRTLGELVRRLPSPLSPSLTSREILARIPLGDAAKGALGSLISATEISHFGGLEPGLEDYQRCVECYRSFVALGVR